MTMRYVTVGTTDYEQCTEKTLLNKPSRYTLRRAELLSGEEIAQKQTDPENRFKDVATLTDLAFSKFTQKATHINMRNSDLPKDLQSNIAGAIDLQNSEIPARLKHMGLFND